MYRFFVKHFGLPGDTNTTEAAYTPLPCRALTVTKTARVMDSIPDSITAHDLLLQTEARLRWMRGHSTTTRRCV